MINLNIVNADEPLLKVIKALLKMHPSAKLKVDRSSQNKLTAYETQILKEVKELKKEIKQGKKGYASMAEYRKARGLE